jgi:hypothetical protein
MAGIHHMKTKTILQTIAFLAVIAISFNACRKYDEGPHISLRSRIGRLTGDWKAKSITADGVEQLHEDNAHTMICQDGTELSYHYINDVSDLKFTFSKDGKWKQSTTASLQEIDSSASYDSCAVVYRTTNSTNSAAGTWEFINDEEQINFKSDNNTNSDILDIKELREKELIFEMLEGTTVIRMVFEKE